MFTFLAPIFLGGALFLTLPWLLHQIRRPEREPMPFSSLMFVPNIKKEVIERRRIQHILLMLLRMLILLLLVMAFARPSWQDHIAVNTPDAASWNVILIDQSYSMQASDHFDQAKSQALEIINSLSNNDRVGLIAFDSHPEVISPLWNAETPDGISVNEIKQLINDLEPTNQTTDFLSALQAAQNEFSVLNDDESNENEKWIVHVISDFQENGITHNQIDWRLPERFQLELHPVGNDEIDNVAITDHVIRETKTGELQLVTKIRNSATGYDQEIKATLFLSGDEINSSTLRITPGNSSQLSFWIPKPQNAQLYGWIELPEDDLLLDNKRFIAWNAPSKTKISMLSEADQNKTRTSSWFLTQAIPQKVDLPWQLQRGSLQEGEQLSEQNIILMVDLNKPDQQLLSSVLDQVKQGGKLFLILSDTLVNDQINDLFFKHLGFNAKGLKHDLQQQDNFQLMSWIDFDHSIFSSFKGAQYNDFSNLIFHNYIEVDLLDKNKAKALARFDTAENQQGDVAVFESKYGEGNVIVWTFSPDLQQNNLVRSTKFIPVLYETLNYLADHKKTTLKYTIGDRLRWPELFAEQSTSLILNVPDKEQPETGKSVGEIKSEDVASINLLDLPGIIKWTKPDTTDSQLQAVNIDTVESNLKRIPLEDFQFKFSSAPIVRQVESQSPTWLTAEINQEQETTEYGRWVIGLLLIFFIAEMVYASRLM